MGYFAPNKIGGRSYFAPNQPPAAVVAQPDGIPPSFAGTLKYTKTSASITLDWSNTTSGDNVAVARREYRIGGSGAYTPASTAEETTKQHTFTGLASSTVYQLEVRCVDTSGNVSQPLVLVVTTSAAPPAGGGEWNYIRYELVTNGHVPHLYLATVEWALFAQLSPRNFGPPIAQGGHAMDAGSALLEIEVPAASVPPGWYFLVLSDADGTTTLACPVLVVD